MNSVYIFGPIFLHGENYMDFYKRIGSLSSHYFDNVVATYPDYWETNETPREFYDRTYDVITKLDFFVGEVTTPSWGVGMEFQMAQEHNIPCIGVCKTGTKQSSMVQGLPTLQKIVEYDSVDDLIEKLKPIFKNLTSIKREK